MKRIEVAEKSTILEVVQTNMGYTSTTKARKIIKNAHVRVNGKMVNIPSTVVDKGDAIEVYPEPLIILKKIDIPPCEVVFENKDFLAFIKPAGYTTAHPDPKVRTSFNLMKRWMQARDPQMTDIHFVNKIEKDASGIVLVAKNFKWRKYLQDEWATFRRRYYVLVDGDFSDSGVIRVKTGTKIQTEVNFPFRRMKSNGLYSLVRIDLEEGQKDMFDDELKGKGIPIVGNRFDRKKGDAYEHKAKHFFSIEIPDMDKKEVHLVKTPVPKAFLKLTR